MRRALPALLVLVGCRPDPGAPHYATPDEWNPAADDEDFYGDDPFEAGEQRLDIGLFYEGGSSEAVPIDDVSTHFYIYESTFALGASDDRVEGYIADSVETTGNPWWGGGIHWDAARDLSKWSQLHLSVKTRDAAMVDVQVGMNGGGNEAAVSLSSLGFSADGEWHTYNISLQGFIDAGVDLTGVTVPLLLLGEGSPAGDVLLIDDLYYSVGDGGGGDDGGDAPDLPDFLGDDPYEEGDQRLSLGAFYEGGYSDVREIDNESRFFYIFDSTFTMTTSEDRVEGYTSDVLEMGSVGWFGGGIHWDEGEDLSGWDSLHAWVKSDQAAMEAATFGMTGGDIETSISLAELGFVADGTWQEVTLPLSELSAGGTDLTNVTVPLLILGEGVASGDPLFIDDLFLTVD